MCDEHHAAEKSPCDPGKSDPEHQPNPALITAEVSLLAVLKALE